MLKKSSEIEHRLRELFHLSMQGDSSAYESFLTLVAGLVQRNLLFLGRGRLSPEQSEELQQEVMLSIHQKKHTYTLDRPLLPWIYAIARYRFIDDYRQKKRLPLLAEWSDDFVFENESEEVDWDELLSLLNPKQKELFLRIKVEGQSYQQAADELGQSVPAVKVGVHRIMKMLKTKVQR